MLGEISAIYISNKKGMPKKLIREGNLKKGYGLVGDVHAKGGKRQVSLFTEEGRNKIETNKIDGLCTKKFCENITIKNMELAKLQVGSIIKIGESIIEITQIGKECFLECRLLGNDNICPLPKEVIFAKVIKSGNIKIGDKILIMQWVQ